jgi:hypothetical protein
VPPAAGEAFVLDPLDVRVKQPPDLFRVAPGEGVVEALDDLQVRH